MRKFAHRGGIMFEVSISGWFAAAHQLRLLDGSLETLHGHNWRVVVTYRGPSLDDMGVLVDFTVVKPRLERLLAGFHDKNLNDHPAFAELNPSAENVAVVVAREMKSGLAPSVSLYSVEIEEAPGCIARYLPQNG